MGGWGGLGVEGAGLRKVKGCRVRGQCRVQRCRVQGYWGCRVQWVLGAEMLGAGMVWVQAAGVLGVQGVQVCQGCTGCWSCWVGGLQGTGVWVCMVQGSRVQWCWSCKSPGVLRVQGCRV